MQLARGFCEKPYCFATCRECDLYAPTFQEQL